MLIVDVFNSTMDRNGNRYWAFTATNRDNGATVTATIDGAESNLNMGIVTLFGDWESVSVHVEKTNHEYAIREFDRITKLAPCAGCRAGEIAQFLIRHLGPIDGSVLTPV